MHSDSFTEMGKFVNELKRLIDKGRYWEDAWIELEREYGVQNMDAIERVFEKKYGQTPNEWQKN